MSVQHRTRSGATLGARRRATLLGTWVAAMCATAMFGGPLQAASPDPSSAPLPPTACPSGSIPARGSIATIAGSGGGASTGDGGPGTAASIDVQIGGLAVDAEGAVYFSGAGYHVPRRIGLDGIITSLTGTTGTSPVKQPGGLAFDAAGDLLVADALAHHIWKVDPAGSVTSFAGTGEEGSAGDGGRAVDAQVSPFHLAVGPRGEMYFDDAGRYRVIDPSGVVHAFAGTGVVGFAGDGGPATAALFSDDIEGIAVDASGAVYLADTDNSRIRRVDPSGTITTFAGTGAHGRGGDGGSALEASFLDPVDLAFGADGSLYVSEHHSYVVRRIDPAGIITTVAGIGSPGIGGDCGPATAAGMQPWAIAVHDDVLYIGDMASSRVRVVKL